MSCPHSLRKRQSDSARKSQQRGKRMKVLLKKSAEYSVKCDADVLLLVRIRKNGQTHVFNSSITEQWLPTPSILDRCYPPPIKKTLKDIIPGYDGSGSNSTYGGSDNPGK